MDARILSTLAHLSNHELLEQVKLLAHHEREVTAALIAHLGELDQRRLYLAEGCSSLFAYCTQVLHLSEYAAYGRIQAARAARKFPVILALLADGAVTLTTVGLLAPLLTPENHAEVLRRARHKSKRQVEELVAQLCPKPGVPVSVRRLPTPSLTPASTAALPEAAVDSQAVGNAPGAESQPLVTPEPTPALTPARRAVVAPLAPQCYRVQFTATADTYQKLQLAQDMLRHQIPDGDLGEIFDRALTALLQNVSRQKLAATDRPREGGGTGSSSRHIPAQVKRAVWLRDGGRCDFVSPKGRRCNARAFLEFHHVVPHGVGGEATIDNIQLLCRAHNGYEAELYFGPRVSAVLENHAPYLSAPTRRNLQSRTRMAPVTRSGPSCRADARPP